MAAKLWGHLRLEGNPSMNGFAAALLGHRGQVYAPTVRRLEVFDFSFYDDEARRLVGLAIRRAVELRELRLFVCDAAGEETFQDDRSFDLLDASRKLPKLTAITLCCDPLLDPS